MAMSHLFAFSSSVLGAGIAAGSPYACGALPGGHLPKGKCYYGGTDVQASIEYIHRRFRDGLIDNPEYLQSTPIVIFNGKRDWEVYTKVSREIFQQLEAFVGRDYLTPVFGTHASHVWSLDHGYCTCGQCANSMWAATNESRLGNGDAGDAANGLCCDVNNCHYDFSGDVLSRAYGRLRPREEARQPLFWIPQREFLPPWRPSWSHALMREWAIAYVPTGCRNAPGECRVHLHYHGCIGLRWSHRLRWIQNLDLNEYGEANDIIVLYPQAHGDKATGVGCWNWGFPHDDELYDTRSSVQLRTVVNMLNDMPKALRLATELPFDEVPPSVLGEDIFI